MKFALLTVAVLFIGCCDATPTSEKCQQLTDYTSRLLAKLEEVLPAGSWRSFKAYTGYSLGFSVGNATAREILLCNIAAAKNQRELFDVLPRNHFRSYRNFEMDYARMQREIARFLGGYTNAQRLANLAKDMDDFGNQWKPAKSIDEKTDLATLTEFMKMLQVKYGSRAISYLVGEKNGDFLVKDPEELAKKLYEGDPNAIREYTGLNYYQVKKLMDLVMGRAMRYGFNHMELLPLLAEGVTLLGDMGLYTLEP